VTTWRAGPVVAPKFIMIHEALSLVHQIGAAKLREGRRFLSLEELDLPLAWTVHDRAVAWLGEPLVPEPSRGSFVWMVAGSRADAHQPASSDPRHVRCDVILTQPQIGGQPVLDDEIQFLEPRDMLVFMPGRHAYAATPASAGALAVLSFGFLDPYA